MFGQRLPNAQRSRQNRKSWFRFGCENALDCSNGFCTCVKTVTDVTTTGRSMEASGNEIGNALISKTSVFLRMLPILVCLGKQTVSLLMLVVSRENLVLHQDSDIYFVVNSLVTQRKDAKIMIHVLIQINCDLLPA